MKKRGLSLSGYVFLAYGFTWFCWVLAIVLGYDDIVFSDLVKHDFQSTGEFVRYLVFRLGVYGPLIASLIMTYYTRKKEGLKEFGSRLFKWNISFKWYLLVLFFPIVVNLVTVLYGVMLGIPLANFFKSSITFGWILPYLLFEFFTSGMEEPGWRGYALEKLQEKYNAEKASWILGILWAVWHFPYMIYLYHDQKILILLFSLIGFTMAIIGQTFILTWFYNNTGSIFIVVLAHAFSNAFTTLISGNITITNPTIGTIPALATWGIVLILLKIYGGETLTKEGQNHAGR